MPEYDQIYVSTKLRININYFSLNQSLAVLCENVCIYIHTYIHKAHKYMNSYIATPQKSVKRIKSCQLRVILVKNYISIRMHTYTHAFTCQ